MNAAPPARGAPILDIERADKVYANGTRALDPVDLTIRSGDFVTLLGPSGCGKSTLLKMAAGLLEATSGRIAWHVGGETGASPTSHAMSFVFQEPTLMPWTTVEANVRLPLELEGANRSACTPTVASALTLVGLGGFEASYPRQLSGGMQMRVSIARALVTEPTVMLMDEPFGALDEFTRNKLDTDLLAMWQARALTVMFVTHSIYEAVFLSTRVVVMAARPGRVIGEIAIDEPYPRDDAFRVSTRFADYARRATELLTQAARSQPAANGQAEMGERFWRVAAPLLVGLVAIGAWQGLVSAFDVPKYIVPGPAVVFETLVADWGLLSDSLLITLKITFCAFFLAVAIGTVTAYLFVQSRWIETSLFPYAVLLQVTPLVAIAPLIIIWVKNAFAALVVCATIVALFPIISNTTVGLRSVNPGLVNLFRMYKASRMQTLLRLRIPSAAPYFFAGLRISSGLALIGAVVAEFVAGTGGTAAGLAYQILIAGFNLNIPRLFAALVLISLTGVALFLSMVGLSWLALHRWHESALASEK